jgi:hypothetical protein
MPAIAPQATPDTRPRQSANFIPEIHIVETGAYSIKRDQLRDEVSNWLENSAFLTIKYGLINVDDELARLSQLQPNWDSYGAEPPSGEAIRSARSILGELFSGLILPSAIVPSAGGGVSIYFMKGVRTSYIENYNSGAQALVMFDQEGNSEVLELGIEVGVAEVGGRIMGYLDQQ